MLHHIPELIIRKRTPRKGMAHRMSRSEDYLDQLLKGVAPEEADKADLEQNTSEENIFSDILEEFADGATEGEGEADFSEEAFDEEDIFGDDFLDDDFLDEDFLKEFEMEMAKLEDEPEETGSEEDALSLFDDLDSILSGAKEKMEAEPDSEPDVISEPEVESEIEFEPETEHSTDDGDDDLAALLGMGDDFSADEQMNEDVPVEVPAMDEPMEEQPAMGGDFSFADLFADESSDNTEATPQEDPDVLKILEGLDGIDLELDEEDNGPDAGNNQDFSALEGFLAASAAEPLPESSDMDGESFAFEDVAELISESAEEKKGKNKKEKKAGEKTGFMNKLGLILFGEDDDEDEDDFVLFNKKGAAKGKAKVAPAPGPAEQGNVTIGVASDDDLALFGDYSGAATPSAPVEEEPKKGKKEKKKKEKKEKVKKEKVKKEKKPRPKKEKKPKEPDNTPPLPKKPVFLILLMVASFVALVVLGADLLGYSNQLTNAKNQYAKKNYSEAFAEISGMEIKEDDMELYNKYHVMAMVSGELEAYESLMSKEFYDMALDCLVRTIGRAEKYRVDAETYGCIQELNELELKAETILSETFGISKEQALEFYSYRSKKEYSVALAKVLKDLGLEKVTE